MREPHQAIAIENALMRENIPYRTLEMARYLEREEILFLRGVMAIALDNFAATHKARRGAIFDAVVTFAEVRFSREDDVAQLRQAVIDEPAALQWLFKGRVDQQGEKEVGAGTVRDRVKALADNLNGAMRSQDADLVLGSLRAQLAGLLDFVQADGASSSDTALHRAAGEVERTVSELTASWNGAPC